MQAMLRKLLLLYKKPVVGGGGVWGCPVGAEGYNADGDLAVDIDTDGTVSGDIGMVVFKTPGTYEVNTPGGTVELLVVAGGGGSGMGTDNSIYNGGGGGAGGHLYDDDYSLSGGAITVTVGDGGAGAGAVNARGVNGDDSVFADITATGGGGGGSSSSRNGGNGGSGGGSGTYSSNVGTKGTGIAGQGNDGSSLIWTFQGAGAGGGSGGAASSQNGGVGTSRFGFTYTAGGRGTTSVLGTGSATPIANTGHGGGCQPRDNGDTGNNGSSGVVIIRWGGYEHNYNPTA